MLRNRRGATSLRWLRALLDHGIEVHGQVVVCPGLNDGAVLDDTLAGVLDRSPSWPVLCVVPLGVSRYNTEAPHAAPHRRRGRGRRRHASRTGRTSSCAIARPPARVRRPTSTTCWPAGPSRRRRAYEGFPMHEDGIGMARTFELEFARRQADARPAPRPASSPGSTAAPADGLPSPTAAPGRRSDQPLQRPPVAPRAGRRSSPGPTAPRCSRPLAGRLGRTTCGSCRSTTSSSAATSGSPACWWGRTSPGCLADEPAGHRYLLPDVCLSDGPLPRRHHARGPAPARRGRRHRRPAPCGPRSSRSSEH